LLKSGRTWKEKYIAQDIWESKNNAKWRLYARPNDFYKGKKMKNHFNIQLLL